jgi:inositol-phosphate transport system permease protein
MKHKQIQPYIFLLPFIVMVVIFYVLPAVITIAMSFTDLNGSFIWHFIGLDNYKRIFKDPNTTIIIWNTVRFVVVTIVLTISIDLFIAIMTGYYIKKETIGNIFKSIWMIPMITPIVVYSVMWIWLLEASKNGMLNKVAYLMFGIEPVNWIASYPVIIVICATIVVKIAYGTIIFSSAIRSIPEDQFKAAKVDGANDIETIKSIILPNLKWHISFLVLWETLGLLTDYVMILLITNGGPGVSTEVWSLASYHKAFIDMRYGYGAAISMILILTVIVLMIFITYFMRIREKQGGKIA